jgi:hypothetical protein
MEKVELSLLPRSNTSESVYIATIRHWSSRARAAILIVVTKPTDKDRP